MGKAIADAWRKAEAAGGSKYTGVKVDGHPIFRSTDAEDPYDYVVAVNVRRRHLSSAQRTELLEQIIKADPTMSARRAAKLAGTSPSTGTRTRKRLQESGDVRQVDTSTDTLGRKQPSTRPFKRQRDWTQPAGSEQEPEEQEPPKQKKKRDPHISFDDIVATVGKIIEEASAYSPARLLSFFDALYDKAAEGLALPQCVEESDRQKRVAP
jgi:hypothetical protein